MLIMTIVLVIWAVMSLVTNTSFFPWYYLVFGYITETLLYLLLWLCLRASYCRWRY